jgi:enoyl-CoA hydratase
VVGHEQLLPFTRTLAQDVVSNDQLGVRQMLATYAEQLLTTGDEAWRIEDRVSRSWEGPGFDPASIEARRQGVIDRGRAQQG